MLQLNSLDLEFLEIFLLYLGAALCTIFEIQAFHSAMVQLSIQYGEAIFSANNWNIILIKEALHINRKRQLCIIT